MSGIVSGLKMATLLDTSETHNFVSKKAAKSLHPRPKRSTRTCKVVNSTLMLMIGIGHFKPLRVGEWFENMDMLVSPLDDHAMILGMDNLRTPKSLGILRQGCDTKYTHDNEEEELACCRFHPWWDDIV